MSTLDNIDMWREILVRLPAESLFRFRVVSKGWRAVIDDPYFVREHTNKNHQQQQLSSSSNIIIQTAGSSYSLDLEALINSYGHQAITATPVHLKVITTNLLSSCNGLVLTLFPALTILNPLTHERLELPPGSYKGDRDSYQERAIGLGYDGTTYDYKAVVILRSRETHIYGLKSDSWRRIINCPQIPDEYDPGVFVCGAFNWLSTRECDDDYNVTTLPPAMLGGCLAVCHSVDSFLDVWVMKVYGDEDSWTKLFSIEREQNNISAWSGRLRPVAFFMNERFVFLQDENKKFFLFDVETKTFKWVKIGSLKNSLCLYARQMFVGNIIRLHANCGGGGRVREIAATSCTTKRRKKASANVQLVFCIRDANGEYNVCCTERGCRLPGENNFSLGGGNGWWLRLYNEK